MSFILDALKKSEAERQRQTGPTLLELRVTHPRRRYPVWAAIIGGLLAVNVIVLLFVALHRPAAPGGTANVGAPTPSRPVSGTGTVAPPAAPLSAAARYAPASASGPPRTAPAPAPAVSPIAAGAAAQATPVSAVPPLTGAVANAAAANAAAARNPADDAPAVPGAQPPLTRAGYAALPMASSLGDDLPALQLNMLVSSSRPADRYALVNMHQVHEGDVLPEGVKVLAITPDGVAMEYRGQDFLLPRATAPPPPAQ